MRAYHPSSIALSLLLAAAPALPASGFRYWDVQDTLAVPKTLSALGLYPDAPGPHEPMIPETHGYEVNVPSWDDGAGKTRWVLLKPGASIGYRQADDYWDYPDSVVFIQQFTIDTIPGDTASRVVWETRLLVNRKDTLAVEGRIPVLMDHWYGYSYKWRRDQRDADLVGPKGLDTTIGIFPGGQANAGRMKKWRFPSRNSCAICHRTDFTDSVHGRSVLGFFTAQLNRPASDSADINQLEYFFGKGVLKGAKAANWNASGIPRWYGVEDASTRATVDTRARSYLAANCSGCHGRRGIETGATFGLTMDFDFHAMAPRIEFRHHPVSWSFGLDTLAPMFYPKFDRNNPKRLDSLVIRPALAVPGYPQKSLLLFRQISRNAVPGNFDEDRNQMSLLTTYEVDEKAVSLLTRWIQEMPLIDQAPSGSRAPKASARPQEPLVQGREIVLPEEMAAPGRKVSLTGIDGRMRELIRRSRTLYALPPDLPPGIYILKAGGRSFRRSLF